MAFDFDITGFVSHGNPAYYSSSIVESGVNVGADTWAAALRDSGWIPDGISHYMRAWALDTGAWDESSVNAWTLAEVKALCLQRISGDLREAIALYPGNGCGGVDWKAYETSDDSRGDLYMAEDGLIYFSVSI